MSATLRPSVNRQRSHRADFAFLLLAGWLGSLSSLGLLPSIFERAGQDPVRKARLQVTARNHGVKYKEKEEEEKKERKEKQNSLQTMGRE